MSHCDRCGCFLDDGDTAPATTAHGPRCVSGDMIVRNGVDPMTAMHAAAVRKEAPKERHGVGDDKWRAAVVALLRLVRHDAVWFAEITRDEVITVSVANRREALGAEGERLFDEAADALRIANGGAA